jgi:UDP-N-acetylglucosamine 1-carboxyvinyltransferase
LGARIYGAGGSSILIEGGQHLTGGTYTIIGDRIVAATVLSAAACAGGDVTVHGVDYRQLSSVTAILSEAGCKITSEPFSVHLRRDVFSPLSGVSAVRTAPYPGFPTDAQAPVMAALSASSGTTLFVENLFENRFRHVPELIRMGADIETEGRVAVIHGVHRLHGARLEATDLRGGGALVAAALGAEGESTLHSIHHIDRGYEHLEQIFSRLGADITRKD